MVQNLQVSDTPPRGVTFLMLLPDMTDSAVFVQRHFELKSACFGQTSNLVGATSLFYDNGVFIWGAANG